MSFGQWSEVFFLLMMPWFFIRLGVKRVLRREPTGAASTGDGGGLQLSLDFAGSATAVAEPEIGAVPNADTAAATREANAVEPLGDQRPGLRVLEHRAVRRLPRVAP